jgi:Ca2+:H+ antiporter
MARRSRSSREYTHEPKTEPTVPPHSSSGGHHGLHLPQYNHNGHEVTKHIQPEGESGRKGIHPFKFLQICFKSNSFISRWVNILWPVVPVAIALHFARPDMHLAIFITNYIAMIPAANMVGFAGSELARKMPKVLGVIAETTFGSFVEIILFMTLLKTSVGDGNVQVIRAAILGSILANMLLCLGFCFVAGGLKGGEQVFHEAISEAGSGLMLVAGSTCLPFPRISTSLKSSLREQVPNNLRSTHYRILGACLRRLYFRNCQKKSSMHLR